MQRYDDNAAMEILYAHAEEWKWTVQGFTRDTNAFVLLGAEGEFYTNLTNPGRYFLARQPLFFFSGDMDREGCGYMVSDAAEIERTLSALRPPCWPSSGARVITLRNQAVFTLVIFPSCTLYLVEG